MIVSSSQYSVDGTAVKIAATNEVQRHVSIHNTGNQPIYVGPTSAVTTTTGFYIDKAAGIFTVQIDANDELWAIAPSGTHVVTVLQVTA